MPQLTQPEIDRLKELHKRNVYEVKVPIDDSNKEFKYLYLRKPTRQETSFYMARVSGNNPLGAKEDLIKACKVAGDEEILLDDELFLSACTALPELIVFRTAEIKKK